jgi:two-component system response regulator NreC
MRPPQSRAVRQIIRVVIADDHAVVREGIRVLVDAQPDLEVVGEAADGQEAAERAYGLRPDVLVLDLSMPGGGGIETAERIQRRCPDVRVLALTMHEERGYVSRVLRAGATGYVLKRTTAAELVRAIRTVAVGGTYIDPSLAGALIIDQTQRPVRGHAGGQSSGVDELTVREGEVLRLVALGHSNKEIATTLEISVKTVETHKANAMARLGLPNRVALVRFAIDQGWLSGD